MKHSGQKKIIKEKILSNLQTAPGHFELKIAAPWLAKESRAGQFVMVKPRNETTDPLLRIPLAIHSRNEKGISLMYKVVGAGTEILSYRKKGDIIDLIGPLGNGFNCERALKTKGMKVLIAAGGHGIVPLYMLVKVLREHKVEVEVFIGARTKKQILCEEKLKKTGAKIHIATDDGTKGAKASILAPLTAYLKKENIKKFASSEGRAVSHLVYACGPKVMLAALSQELKKYNVDAEFSLEAYMACGIGACLGCAVMTVSGYKMVCKDGPVFDMRSIVF